MIRKLRLHLDLHRALKQQIELRKQIEAHQAAIIASLERQIETQKKHIAILEGQYSDLDLESRTCGSKWVN
jgi:hypothetical protein